MTALAGRDQLGLGGRPGAGGKYKYRGCEGPNSVVGARLQGAPGRPFQKGGSDGEAATGASDILEGFPGLPGQQEVARGRIRIAWNSNSDTKPCNHAKSHAFLHGVLNERTLLNALTKDFQRRPMRKGGACTRPPWSILAASSCRCNLPL